MAEVGVVVDEGALRDAARRWWVPLVLGLVTAVVGVIVIFRPITGVFGLAILIALGFFLSGIGDLASVSQWGSRKWVPVVWGVLGIAVGVVAIVWPGITLWALAVVIGIGLIVRGLLRVVVSVSARPHLWALWALVGVVELVVGVLAIAWPEVTILVLAVVIGIELLFVGLAEIVMAFQLKRLADGR
jgi:uncharacterized membrane protein HdeD (DUF308 family)